MITHDEWQEKTLPIWWIKVTHPGWTSVTRQMINKWIDAHCAGWCYWDNSETYIFGSGADFTLFKLWVASDPFSADAGIFEVEVIV